MHLFLSEWMLYTLLAALLVIGIDMLVGIFKSLQAHTFSVAKLPHFLLKVLHYILPLLLLASLIPLDPTHILILIMYYIGGIGIILKLLQEIQYKFSK